MTSSDHGFGVILFPFVCCSVYSTSSVLAINTFYDEKNTMNLSCARIMEHCLALGDHTTWLLWLQK